MIAKLIKKKGILAKFLEQGIRILLIKECKKISNIKIDIFSSFTQIIKGEIQRISIISEDINYKNLLLDKLELEANHLKINFTLQNRELYFKNNPIIKFKILLSQDSLREILLSRSWSWISTMISLEILNQKKLEDIKIKNDQLLMKTSQKNITINQEEQVKIKTEKGKVYLGNENYKKRIQIPIEDKIYIKNIYIENNLINITGNSSISL